MESADYSNYDKDSENLYSKLDQILEERNRFNTDEFPNLTQIIDRELELIQTGQEENKFIDLLSKSPTKVALKFKLPVKENPQVSYVGRIVGQSGKTVKHLQMLTGCKISVFGQGSIKDKTKEEELRQQGGKYAHLNFELHVTIETVCPPLAAYQRITHAMTLLSALVSPSYLEGSDPVSFLSSYNQSLGYSIPQRAYVGPMPQRPPMRGSPRMMNMKMQRGSSRPPSTTSTYTPVQRRGSYTRGVARGSVPIQNVQNKATWSSDETYPNNDYSYDDTANVADENGYTQTGYNDNFAENYNSNPNIDNYVEDNSAWSEDYKPQLRRGKPMGGSYRTKPY